MEEVLKQIVNPFIFDITEEQEMMKPTITPFLQESYAQRYEDVIVMSLLDAYALKVSSPKNFGYVEFGGNHPVSTSSTYLLSKKYGCHGILVEANHELALQLREHRPDDLVIDAAVVAGYEQQVELVISKEHELSSTDKRFVKRFVEKGMTRRTVQAVNVNHVLHQAKEKYDIFSLFIDVEGPDADILEAINYEEYRPITIQIEASEAIVPGNTDRIRKIMMNAGYILIAHTYINFIFIDGERLS